MDVRRRDYVLVNGEHYSRRPLDAAWVLERFPPEPGALEAPVALRRPRLRSEAPEQVTPSRS